MKRLVVMITLGVALLASGSLVAFCGAGEDDMRDWYTIAAWGDDVHGVV